MRWSRKRSVRLHGSQREIQRLTPIQEADGIEIKSLEIRLQLEL
jgi:hypothetical protein